MPKIQVPSIFICTLKQAGCYNKWLNNVKTQWDTDSLLNPLSVRTKRLGQYYQYNHGIADLIVASFYINSSVEGESYWNKKIKECETIYSNIIYAEINS